MTPWCRATASRGVVHVWVTGEIVNEVQSGEQAVEVVKAAGSGPIVAHIDCLGGCSSAALILGEFLARARARTIVEGVAASAGGLVAVHGAIVDARPGARLFVHNPVAGVIGHACELRQMADLLDASVPTVVKIYARKTGRPADEIQRWMDASTWFSATEALEAGLIDRILPESPVIPATTENLGTTVPKPSTDDEALCLEVLHALGPIKVRDVAKFRREIGAWFSTIRET